MWTIGWNLAAQDKLLSLDNDNYWYTEGGKTFIRTLMVTDVNVNIWLIIPVQLLVSKTVFKPLLKCFHKFDFFTAFRILMQVWGYFTHWLCGYTSMHRAYNWDLTENSSAKCSDGAYTLKRTKSETKEHLLVTIIVILIVTAKSCQTPLTDTKREKDLCTCVHPNLTKCKNLNVT